MSIGFAPPKPFVEDDPPRPVAPFVVLANGEESLQTFTIGEEYSRAEIDERCRKALGRQELEKQRKRDQEDVDHRVVRVTAEHLEATWTFGSDLEFPLQRAIRESFPEYEVRCDPENVDLVLGETEDGFSQVLRFVLPVEARWLWWDVGMGAAVTAGTFIVALNRGAKITFARHFDHMMSQWWHNEQDTAVLLAVARKWKARKDGEHADE